MAQSHWDFGMSAVCSVILTLEDSKRSNITAPSPGDVTAHFLPPTIFQYTSFSLAPSISFSLSSRQLLVLGCDLKICCSTKSRVNSLFPSS